MLAHVFPTIRMEDHTPFRTDSNSQAGTRVRRKRVKRSRSRRSGWRRTLDKWTAFDGADAARVLGFLIEGLLIAMILLAPLPLGSVSPWARTLLFLGACVLLCLWVVRASLLGRLEIVRSHSWVFVVAYLLILCFQLIPLPHSLLSGLSPKAADLYAALVPGYPGSSGLESVSMNPNATVQEIFRVLTFAIVLFVFLNYFRDRRQIAGVLWALVALGLFQSFYGLAEKFSGNPHICSWPLLPAAAAPGELPNSPCSSGSNRPCPREGHTRTCCWGLWWPLCFSPVCSPFQGEAPWGC